MGNRSSHPHHCPGALKARWVEEIEDMRRTHKWSAARISFELIERHGGATRPRTVGRWLERRGISRRRDLDPTGGSNRVPGVIRLRYRGHTDVKKVGRIPTGGGWRVHGRGTDAARIDELESERLQNGRTGVLVPILGSDDPAKAFHDSPLEVSREANDILMVASLLPVPQGRRGFDSVRIELKAAISHTEPARSLGTIQDY